MSIKITHIGFADESHWNKGRFRSLGMVTLPFERLKDIEAEIEDLLSKSQVKEFKWNKLDGAKERLAAEKLCTFAIEKAYAAQLRVDVLIWDIEDRRHKIARRDDIANLNRMYYHLFHNVLRARWPSDAVWMICPDEHTALNMKTVKECLEKVKTRKKQFCRPLFSDEEFVAQLHKKFGIQEIKEVSSIENPLIQIADLFAGLAVFSHEKFDEYQDWLESTSPQLSLLNKAKGSANPSRSSRVRFHVLKAFDEMCKERRLGVSLKTKRGLGTHNPENPINFWMYDPQCPEDKAPRK